MLWIWKFVKLIQISIKNVKFQHTYFQFSEQHLWNHQSSEIQKLPPPVSAQ